MDFSQQIDEALERTDQARLRALLDSEDSDDGVLTTEMIARALESDLEEAAVLMLAALHRHCDLTDDSARRLVALAAARGHHSFLRALVQLDGGPGATEAVLRESSSISRAPAPTDAPPLHAAVLRAEPPAVLFLLAQVGAPVNAQDKDGDSALHLAVRSGGPQVVEALLQCGVSPVIRNKLGQTATEAALQDRREDLAALVRSHEPGLVWGLERGDARAVLHALRRWVSPHTLLDAATPPAGRTGLEMGARRFAGPGLVESLLLVHRVLSDDLRGVRALLSDPPPGLNLNLAHRDSGLTPLGAAVRRGNGPMAAELLRRGAVVNVRVDNVPLLCRALAAWKAPLLLVETLMARDTELSAELPGRPSAWRERDPGGLTPLLRAVACGRAASEISALLRRAPDVLCLAQRSADGRAQNARELAEAYGRLDVVDAVDAAVATLLSRCGRSDAARAALMRLAIAFYGRANFLAAADVMPPPEREREGVQRFLDGLAAVEDAGAALMRAVKADDLAAVKSLNRADYSDQNGLTALTRAVVLDRFAVAEWLVSERPQLNYICDNDNRYPLHYAYALPEEVGDKFVGLLLSRGSPWLQEARDKDGNIPCAYRERAGSAEGRELLDRVASLDVYGVSK